MVPCFGKNHKKFQKKSEKSQKFPKIFRKKWKKIPKIIRKNSEKFPWKKQKHPFNVPTYPKKSQKISKIRKYSKNNQKNFRKRSVKGFKISFSKKLSS